MLRSKNANALCLFSMHYLWMSVGSSTWRSQGRLGNKFWYKEEVEWRNSWIISFNTVSLHVPSESMRFVYSILN